MTYELCLEYGTYPLTVPDAQLGEDNQLPAFIQDDQWLLDKLEEVNGLFHQLFLIIESQFHYVGHEFPEKRARINELYDAIISHLQKNYPNEDITITKLLIS
ncbi:hypothetical protein N1495_04275 [Streptococcus didelphis]|uniref:Uncharacterized protein n=1 Tax=Streptococcus didelphis TaxID=102886 RepID=A0ABY9LJ12_9STRE|nr:hypothetical protein [Streptococcus didelphis]WMB28140.1 hypothetical protein N1496_09740 [Streptococcus didelphis]WMB30061.1 hypothetical protein N1495_04275 [Streptococcus didelphis]